MLRAKLPRRWISAGAFACALLAAPFALAHGGGGGMGMGGGMGLGGGMSGMHGDFGGASASHMSGEGLANTNGPSSSNRVFGRNRASLRHTSSHHSLAHGMSASRSHHRNFGGRSSSHISANGLRNTNGPNAASRSFGVARAQERRP